LPSITIRRQKKKIIQEKRKDKDVKKQMRESLEVQIKEKQRKLDDEKASEVKYKELVKLQVDSLNQVEKEKILQKKEQIQKEKKFRDVQLKENKKKRINEFREQRKYEGQLISKCLDDIEREKEIARKRKENEKEHQMNVLHDNEINKLQKELDREKEKEENIKAGEAYTEMLNKQEKERDNYFKNRAKIQSGYMNKMAETVVKEQDEKYQIEQETIKRYQQEIERKTFEDENRKKLRAKMNKQDMKTFLETQMKNKRKLCDFEKELDTEQLKIWRDDLEAYQSKEKDIKTRVWSAKADYGQYLKGQIQEHNQKKATNMDDVEYDLNKEILLEIKGTKIK